MSLTYAGVELVAPTAEVAGWIEQNIRLADIFEAGFPNSSGPGLMDWQPRSFRHQDLLVEVGTLSWPRTASRWAMGHFLAHGSQVEQIRAVAYGGPAGSQSVAQPLIMGDGTNAITTDLFLLPPRPLAQLAEPNTLYLLTLVDERFYWWWKAADIEVVGGTTSWQVLFAAIGTALGVTIAVDPISSAYLQPPSLLTAHYQFLPPLLDAVAASVGQVIVRGLDGKVSSQNTTTAQAADDRNLANNWPVLAGGYFQTR